jgi:hypothetical protein
MIRQHNNSTCSVEVKHVTHDEDVRYGRENSSCMSWKIKACEQKSSRCSEHSQSNRVLSTFFITLLHELINQGMQAKIIEMLWTFWIGSEYCQLCSFLQASFLWELKNKSWCSASPLARCRHQQHRSCHPSSWEPIRRKEALWELSTVYLMSQNEDNR